MFMPQQPIQSFAAAWSADLLCISRAYGCDRIGIDDPRFHAVDIAIVLDLRQCILPEAQQIIRKHRVHQPLIAEVVNREHRFNAGEFRQCGILLPKQQRNHARLPIVQVNDIRHNIQLLHYFKCRFRKPAVTLRLEIAA